MVEVNNSALPQTTVVIVPKKQTKAAWYLRHEHKRDSLNLIVQQPKEKKTFEQLMEDNRNATTDAEQKAAKSELLKHYVKVVQQESKKELRRQPEGFPAIEYEEIVSIGIIAMQAIIKNKTIDELAETDDKYLSTVIKWTIRDELKYRYEWYPYMTKWYEWVDGEDGSIVHSSSSFRREFFRHAIELAKSISYQYFNLQSDINYRIEYEEILASGIIGLQAFIKDKDAEALSKYNDAYIELIVKWSIMQMLSIRYDWFEEKCLPVWSEL